MIVLSGFLSACAPASRNADAMDAQMKSSPANEETPANEPPVVKVQFKSQPTVMVMPALTGRTTGTVDVVRRNPLAKTAMETINAYLAARDYNVVSLESQSQIDEAAEFQSNIAGDEEDLAYLAGLSLGADVNVSYSGSMQDGYIVVDLTATEPSTARLLASESIRMKDNDEGQRVLVQKAVGDAIAKLETKMREQIAKDMEIGSRYKVIVRFVGDLTDDQANELSDLLSKSLRENFNKMQIISMTRTTFDFLVYADIAKYEDAQMVYEAISGALDGRAKVRKLNITKKLLILEIQ